MEKPKIYQLKDGTWTDFETYMAHNVANIGQQVLGLYAMLDVSPEGIILKVKKKHFWNGWDIKSILAIVVPFLTIVYYAGGLENELKQTRIDTTHNTESFTKLQSDHTEVKLDLYVLENKVSNLKEEVENHFKITAKYN